ncbi:aminopeptidase C [Rudaeicoccus suwonensis]|uniref:Aminopeptidase n=1 Tax=Rudaeicoccus suwonensis TaxID=657409 RepID=A0A561EB61_9MICO|nr:C1 family peptidase [Rudaeicoccus suwonensis]TWE12827.1 bleomycin hydrolase [Rudaeicoccus suwonensis]
MANMTHSLTEQDVELLKKDFDSRPVNRIVQNAVTQTAVADVALDREILTSIDTSMSHRLDSWSVTNQKKSGRCWMFAGLNLLRPGAMKRLGLKEFEFSQNHLLFWDKLERCNYFLESMAQLSDRPTDDRTLGFVMQDVMGDGGQWNMFAALVKKHGLVPKTVMPESHSSSETAPMNSHLRSLLREAARDVRSAGSPEDVEQVRSRTMAAAYRILAIHLGTPPERFEWQWTDDSGEFHRAGMMSPLEFAERYLTIDVDDYVCLVDDPRPSSPRGRTFTVDQLGNIVGGDPVRYLNVQADELRKLAAEAIVDGEPVWFGCDVGKMMQRNAGVWDAELYDFAGIYDTAFSLDKAARLEYHETLMTHAMLLTGVDLDGDMPRKWRVENSWGDEHADKGFYTMNDSWFGEYVFEIAARRDKLSPRLRDALDAEPIVLPAWDPMGSLA